MIKAMIRGLRPLPLLALGIAAVGAGLLYDLTFAGLPFQDPSPELHRSWTFHHELAGWIIGAGLAVLSAGAVSALVALLVAPWRALARR